MEHTYVAIIKSIEEYSCSIRIVGHYMTVLLEMILKLVICLHIYTYKLLQSRLKVVINTTQLQVRSNKHLCNTAMSSLSNVSAGLIVGTWSNIKMMMFNIMTAYILYT